MGVWTNFKDKLDIRKPFKRHAAKNELGKFYASIEQQQSESHHMTMTEVGKEFHKYLLGKSELADSIVEALKKKDPPAYKIFLKTLMDACENELRSGENPNLPTKPLLKYLEDTNQYVYLPIAVGETHRRKDEKIASAPDPAKVAESANKSIENELKARPTKNLAAGSILFEHNDPHPVTVQLDGSDDFQGISKKQKEKVATFLTNSTGLPRNDITAYEVTSHKGVIKLQAHNGKQPLGEPVNVAITESVYETVVKPLQYSSLVCFLEHETEVRDILQEVCKDDPWAYGYLEVIARDKGGRQTAFFDVDTIGDDAPLGMNLKKNLKKPDLLDLEKYKQPTFLYDNDRFDGSLNIAYSSSDPKKIDFLKNKIFNTARVYDKYPAGKLAYELINSESQIKNDERIDSWRNTLPKSPTTFNSEVSDELDEHLREETEVRRETSTGELRPRTRREIAADDAREKSPSTSRTTNDSKLLKKARAEKAVEGRGGQSRK